MKTKAETNQMQGVATTAMLCIMAMAALAPLARAQEDVIPDKTSDVALADTVAPDDVENVKAVSGNGSVALSWNVASDNIAVKGYKIYYGTTSVTEDGATYDLGPIDTGNKITYTVAGLTNGTPYYFAVTAYDEAGNESENYSAEATATPAHGAADMEAPKVSKAIALNNVTVQVTFSEAVSIPGTNPESAFSIKNDSDLTTLAVTDATLDISDSTGKSVLLTTGLQEASTNYIVTAGIQVKDISGNPIVSGTSDTALFAGVATALMVTQETTETVAADTVGPKLVNVTAADANHVTITFDEQVKLGPNPVDNFFITEEENTDATLNILSAVLSADGMSVMLTTDDQKTMNYNLIVLDVTDAAGNLIDVDNNATAFFGGMPTDGGTQETMETQDTVAPEDATNFMAAMKKMLVHLSWMASLNTAGDLAEYVLYKSNDGITYGPGVMVDMAATSLDVADLTPGMKYFFKLAAKDVTGNESQGVVTTFTLPATGPELGFLALGSLGLGKLLKRKKAKK